LLALGAAPAAPRPARAQAIGQGFELERTGRLDQAAALYFAAARGDATNLPALLGLERVLPQLDRLRELLPIAERAVLRDSTNDALRGLLLRTCVALNLPDTAEAVARRWAVMRPHDEAPYREWATALSDGRSYRQAEQVYHAGRKALERPEAFAVELAELEQREGDWEGAAREWALAVTAFPVQVPNAATQLVSAPLDRRDRVIRALTARDDAPAPQRLAAELVLAWGDPARAWAILESTLRTPPADAMFALHRFADLAAGIGTPAAWRVRGLALVRFAELAPPSLAVRARADAARSFLQAGEAQAARAQLQRLAGDNAAPPDVQQLATATLIGALIQARELDSAATRLESEADELGADQEATLRFALARARIRLGQLALADTALGADSSVEAIALHGWIALYRGDLGQARARLRAAGPYAGEQRDATERTAMLALLEQIPGDHLPALGSALLALARGDSGAAVTGLEGAAKSLEPERGRADVLLLAGRIAARLDTTGGSALPLFAEVVRIGGSGAAPPAAELEWARVLARRGMHGEALQHLEHLILTYPESAVVPEARRELARVKGAIPRS
jgi:tetratricopeptide (TPR) repeat protein